MIRDRFSICFLICSDLPKMLNNCMTGDRDVNVTFIYTPLFTTLGKENSQRGSLHSSLNLDCLLLTSDIYLLIISIIKHEYDHFPIIKSFVTIYHFVATKNLLVNPNFFQ